MNLCKPENSAVQKLPSGDSSSSSSSSVCVCVCVCACACVLIIICIPISGTEKERRGNQKAETQIWGKELHNFSVLPLNLICLQ